MKTILYIFIIVLAISFFSCKKILDVEQKSKIPNEIAITSVKDLESVLVGSYDVLQSGNVLGGNMVVYADLLADDTQVDETRLGWFGTMEIYKRRTTIQIGALRGMWADSYAAINRANNVINVIDNNLLSGKDFDAAKNRIKGEALFIRAIVHFELLRFWALPYDVDNKGGNFQPGIPYRTKPTLSGFDDLSMARNSVEDVYNKVITDLMNAQKLFPSTQKHSNSRASEMAVWAYLARVYFQKGDYVNASIASSKVLSDAYYKLNDSINVTVPVSDKYKYLISAFQTSGDFYIPENIFQLVNTPMDQSNSITYNYITNDNSSPLFMANSAIRYIYNSKDKRISKFMSIYPAGIFIKKYSNTNPANNVCLIRLAEIKLIKAESDVLMGAITSDTYKQYTDVKKRAFGLKDWRDETILQSNLLDSIRKERRREMVFEGDRYHNLKRMKQPLRDGVSWNDPSLLFKIPQEEMAGNPLMIQNP